MTRQEVLDRLRSVYDPEIPGLSIVDMGLVASVSVMEDKVEVILRPTFIACPALDWIRRHAEEALSPLEAHVEFDVSRAWSSADMSAGGRDMLQSFGIAPPPTRDAGTVPCPLCGSNQTACSSPFGSALCRAQYYCHECQQPFEAWKTV